MNDVPRNRIHINGTEIDVISGDVSAIDQMVADTLEAGGGWITFGTGQGHHYRLHVNEQTTVVVKYLD
jgi:hypothetical protein